MRTRFLTALLLGSAVLAAAPAHAALVISKGKTSNVDCESGICNATVADAVLNVKDLANMLATTDVKVFAEGAATDINVSDSFSWTSTHRLTLGAYGSIAVKAAITVAGTGGVTISANVAQTGGVFKLVGTGKVSFWDTGSSLIINNTTYTLVNNLPALVNAIATNASGNYAFANDYDASQDGSYPHSPISTTFTGVFEGLGNAIENLSFYNNDASSENIALFSQLDSGGQISNVNLVNVSLQGNGDDIASLVITNYGTVTHSSAGGSISAVAGHSLYMSAGLVLENKGTITRSRATVNIAGNSVWAGGLVLENDGAISLSDATGAIAGTGLVGGLVANSAGTIIDSFAGGSVTISPGGAGAGGLVGELNSGSIERCFSTASVQSGVFGPKESRISSRHLPPKKSGIALGGLVGISSSATISYAYATGSVSRGTRVPAVSPSLGGLVGRTQYYSRLLQTYALGKLILSGKKYLGGVIGLDETMSGGNDAALWDLDTTDVTNPNQGAGNVFDDPGLKGYADRKFCKQAIKNFDRTVWAEDPNINNGYPYLIANPPQ